MEKEESGKSELSPEILERLSNELKKKVKEKISSEELSSELMDELSSEIANDITRRIGIIWPEFETQYHCPSTYICTYYYRCKWPDGGHSCATKFDCKSIFQCDFFRGAR